MSDTRPAEPVPGLARAALLIAIVAIAARIMGFVRLLVFARTIGPTCLGDTYFTANTVPNIVFDVVAGGALSSLVVPVLARPVAMREQAVIDQTTSALLTWVGILLVPLALVGAALTHPLMGLLVGGGHPGCAAHSEIDTGARMLLIFMPQIVLYGIGVVLTGALQAHHRFLGPALGPLLSSIMVIVVYVVFSAVTTSRQASLSALPLSHELILSVGTTLGVVVLVLPLLVPTVRTGVRLRPTYHFPPGVARVVRRMAISGALALAAQDLANGVVLRLTNNGGASGSVVLYNLAYTAFVFPCAVLAVPLATSAFPTLTSAWQTGARAAYSALTSTTSRILIVALGAAAAVMCAGAGPAARVIILGAPGGAAPPVELARALVTFAPGLIGYSLLNLLSRALYAQGDARTPTIAALGGWAIACLADVGFVAVLPRDWAVAGIGAGISIGMTAAGIHMVIAMRRSAGADALHGFARATGAGLLAALVATGVGALVERASSGGGVAASLAAFAAVAAVVVVTYAIVVRLLDRETFALLAARASRLRGRHRPHV